MTLEYFYNLYVNIANKDNRGDVLSIDEFNNLVAQSNKDYQNELLKDYEESGEITDSLQVFITTDTTGLDGSSKLALPSDYAKYSYLIANNGVTDVVVDMVTGEEYAEYSQDALLKPTSNYPQYRIAGGSLIVYPTATFASKSATFEYIKYPSTPRLDWYIDVNGYYQLLGAGETHVWTTGEIDSSGTTHTVGDPNYSSTTVELEWFDKDKLEIFVRVLTTIGYKISSQELVQYGTSQTIKLDTDD